MKSAVAAFKCSHQPVDCDLEVSCMLAMSHHIGDCEAGPFFPALQSDIRCGSQPMFTCAPTFSLLPYTLSCTPPSPKVVLFLLLLLLYLGDIKSQYTGWCEHIL